MILFYLLNGHSYLLNGHIDAYRSMYVVYLNAHTHAHLYIILYYVYIYVCIYIYMPRINGWIDR